MSRLDQLTCQAPGEDLERETAAVAVNLAEGSPVAPVVNIGLKADQIMQRYLVRRIHREVEFKIVETDGHEHVGFITGFDEECIQISTTPRNDVEEPRAVLVFWPIRRIEETGETIEHLDHESKSKIRSYGHALRATCEAHLNGSRNAGGPRPQRVRANGEPVPSFSDGV